MNIVNTLTIRHIKTHKKRSILTIMAIIISVSMVTAVFTSAFSFINYFKNVSEAIDGSWHMYVHTDYDKAKKYLNDSNIEKYGVDLWYASADVDNNSDSFEMELNAADQNYLDLKNVKISKGRMPKKANELLVYQKFIEINNLDWKLGDKVTLPCLFSDQKVKNVDFTIVGITESNVSETGSVQGFVYATDELINEHGQASVYVRFTKTDKTVYTNSEKLVKEISSDPANSVSDYNKEYLMYSLCDLSDPSIITLIGFCSIILVIIAITSIFIIYDSFAVSYQERAKYLGMLASVGATKKQKRNSIYFEGFILGAIGIPLGILAGIGGIGITLRAISDVWVKTLAVEYDGTLRLYINWIVIALTVVASAITIFISSYIPAVKASKTTAIDAIRQANTVKVKNSKKLRTSKLATKILGFEGAIAIKNFKRNGRRSKTIVFALFMSVVVFLSVSNFSLMFNDVMKSQYTATSDLTVTVPIEKQKELNSIINNTKNVREYFGITNLYAQADKSYFTDDYNKHDYAHQVMLALVDNDTIDSYAKQLGIDPKGLHDKSAPSGILHNTMLVKSNNTKKLIEPLNDLNHKDFKLASQIWNAEKGDSESYNTSVNVLYQTTQDYKNDKFYYQNQHLPMLMISIDHANAILGDIVNNSYSVEIVCERDTADEVSKDVQDILSKKNIGCSIYSASAETESINNILTIVKVFVFGFITLITLISILNIINTISNSMNERRREFAMIRSIGMTPKSFKKMVYYESFRYAIVSLLWAIPISVAIHYGMYKSLARSFDYGFKLHPLIYIIAIIAVFIIIGIALLYSLSKIKDDNIIETLKQDIN